MAKEKIMIIIKGELIEIRKLRDELNLYIHNLEDEIFALFEDNSLVGDPEQYDFGKESVSKIIAEMNKSIKERTGSIDNLEKQRITLQNSASKMKKISTGIF